MSNLKYKTRGNSSPQGKPRVYFCCHYEDFNIYFESVSDEILAKQNCAIWYIDEGIVRDEDFFVDLKQMQLFVMPVTTNLLCTKNEALDVEFKFAIENHIPVLPLMQEEGLEELFNKKCGDLQFLDKNNTDITAISYDEKLQKYLESVLIGDELAEKIRAAFDAYVFLSYRKKDRKHAQELMRLIHKNKFCRDIAIWYDEFLTPGENFNDSIKEALKKSGLFVLTVTPNLVNEPNYIMTTEYPMAKQEGKPILPAEIVPTDREQLSEKYADIPDPTDAHNEAELSEALLESIKKMAITENDKSPEHNFFIGLAYLGGVDVEVDHERAIALIKSAAGSGLIEAMKQLVTMYRSGIGTQKSNEDAIEWQKKLCEKLAERYKQSNCEKDVTVLVKETFYLGDLFLYLKSIEFFIETYLIGFKLCKECHSKFNSTNSHILLADSYEKMGDAVRKCEMKTQKEYQVEEPDAYYFKSVSLYKEISHREEFNQLNWNVCRIKIKVGRLRAFGLKLLYMEHAKETAMKLVCKTIAEKQILHKVYLYLAKTYVEPWAIEKHINDAHECFMESIKIANQIAEECGTADAKRYLAESYAAYGELYKNLSLFDNAREYLHKSVKIYLDIFQSIDDIKSLQNLTDIYFCIATVDEYNVDAFYIEKAYDAVCKLVERRPQFTKYIYLKRSIEKARVRTITISRTKTEIEEFEYYDYISLLSVKTPRNITTIGSFAFAKCLSLETVDISYGVMEIGYGAFEDCQKLKVINIPDSVINIKDDAFKNCHSLESIVIPKGIKKINFSTFKSCSSLKSVVLPDGLTEISKDAFLLCTSLTSINIPDGVVLLGGGAFGSCSSLKSIEIPDSVTEIYQGAFACCSSLEQINMPPHITEIRDETFWGCSALTSFCIPNRVTQIGKSAFENCSSLRSIEIPESVSVIEDNAFKGCTGLTSITICRRFENDICRIFGDIDPNIVTFV